MKTKKIDEFDFSNRPKQKAKSARCAAKSLIEGFTWTESEEGVEYWNKIYDRLIDIAYIFEEAISEKKTKLANERQDKATAKEIAAAAKSITKARRAKRAS